MSEAETPVQKRPEFVDRNNVPIVFVDYIVTGGEWEGLLNVVLGSVDHTYVHEEDDVPQVVVAARLRMTRKFATALHSALDGLLGLNDTDELKPPNETPPPNLIN